MYPDSTLITCTPLSAASLTAFVSPSVSPFNTTITLHPCCTKFSISVDCCTAVPFALVAIHS